MENNPQIGHNRPPIAARADILKSELAEQYSRLKKELAALETDFYLLPEAKDIKTDEEAEKVNTWIQRAKKFGKDIADSHGAEKEEFKVLGKAVDDFFFRGFRDPNADNIKTAEQKLQPWALAKAQAAAEKARLIREEAERKAAAERLAEEERQAAARRLEDEARAQAAALRETENQADAEEAAKELIEAEAAKLTEAQNQEAQRQAAAAEQNRLAALARAAEKEKPKGIQIKTEFQPIIDNLELVRAGLGPLGPYFLGNQITDTLERMGKNFTGDQAPPAIGGVTWHKATQTNVRAQRG